MAKASKSLGIFLVIVGTILFFITAGPFILQLLGAIGALYLINWGLELQGAEPLPRTFNIWMMKMSPSSWRKE